MNTFLGLFRRPRSDNKPAPPVKVEVHEVEPAPNVVHVPEPASTNVQQPAQPVYPSSALHVQVQPAVLSRRRFLLAAGETQQTVCIWNQDRTISGFISVANLGFQKAVFVRATANQWESWEDIPAEFLSSDAELERDRFTFSLPVDTEVEFAIAYTVQGKTFWGNNKGKNYFITVSWRGIGLLSPFGSCHRVHSRRRILLGQQQRKELRDHCVLRGELLS